MIEIRHQQQKIIAGKLYNQRVSLYRDSDNIPGSSDGDWKIAGNILDHFEAITKDEWWEKDEEDCGEYRRWLLPGYLEFIKAKKNT